MNPDKPETIQEKFQSFEARLKAKPIAAEMAKPPVRSFKDMSPEEQAKLKAQYERPAKGTEPMDTRANHAIAPIQADLKIAAQAQEAPLVSDLEVLGALDLTKYKLHLKVDRIEADKQTLLFELANTDKAIQDLRDKLIAVPACSAERLAKGGECPCKAVERKRRP
jgi:hypothetical protein